MEKYLYQVVSVEGEPIGVIESEATEDQVYRIRKNLSIAFTSGYDVDTLVERIKACRHYARRIFLIEVL